MRAASELAPRPFGQKIFDFSERPWLCRLCWGPPNVAGLAGLRKDGSIFPVRISLSSVPTATGRFTLALIRDYSVAQPPADLGGLARAAAAARHSRQGQELLDRAVNSSSRSASACRQRSSSRSRAHQVAAIRVVATLDTAAEARMERDPGPLLPCDQRVPTGWTEAAISLPLVDCSRFARTRATR